MSNAARLLGCASGIPDDVTCPPHHVFRPPQDAQCPTHRASRIAHPVFGLTRLKIEATDSSRHLRHGDTGRGKADQDGNTDLELSDLTVEVLRHEALTQQFYKVHLALNVAPAVVSAPSSPE